MKIEIIPSIQTADIANINEELKKAEPYCKTFQIDVEDGIFVKETTPYTPEWLKKVKTRLGKEVHLMVAEPGKMFKAYKDAGATAIIFHIEVGPTEDLLQQLKKLKLKSGIALNPDTPVERVLPYINKVNKIVVMTVFPGKGGQEYIPDALSKVSVLRKAAPNLDIEVDGGIKGAIIKDAIQAGANNLVIGSGIYNENTVAENMKKIIRYANDVKL